MGLQDYGFTDRESEDGTEAQASSTVRGTASLHEGDPERP
jgi:hypothetical protein